MLEPIWNKCLWWPLTLWKCIGRKRCGRQKRHPLKAEDTWLSKVSLMHVARIWPRECGGGGLRGPAGYPLPKTKNSSIWQLFFQCDTNLMTIIGLHGTHIRIFFFSSEAPHLETKRAQVGIIGPISGLGGIVTGLSTQPLPGAILSRRGSIPGLRETIQS